MSASLVGSEMCIRDSWCPLLQLYGARGLGRVQALDQDSLRPVGRPGQRPRPCGCLGRLLICPFIAEQ
eukprot:7717967-Alexandrium_andersonii.AAC.1